MNIELVALSEENAAEYLKLKVSDEQMQYIASNRDS